MAETIVCSRLAATVGLILAIQMSVVSSSGAAEGARGRGDSSGIGITHRVLSQSAIPRRGVELQLELNLHNTGHRTFHDLRVFLAQSVLGTATDRCEPAMAGSLPADSGVVSTTWRVSCLVSPLSANTLRHLDLRVEGIDAATNVRSSFFSTSTETR